LAGRGGGTCQERGLEELIARGKGERKGQAGSFPLNGTWRRTLWVGKKTRIEKHACHLDSIWRPPGDAIGENSSERVGKNP